MCNCNSSWVQNAIKFLNRNNNQNAMQIVVKYLIDNNVCGRKNGIYLKTLFNFVNNNDYNFNRENFQHNV